MVQSSDAALVLRLSVPGAHVTLCETDSDVGTRFLLTARVAGVLRWELISVNGAVW